MGFGRVGLYLRTPSELLAGGSQAHTAEGKGASVSFSVGQERTLRQLLQSCLEMRRAGPPTPSAVAWPTSVSLSRAFRGCHSGAARVLGGLQRTPLSRHSRAPSSYHETARQELRVGITASRILGNNGRYLMVYRQYFGDFGGAGVDDCLLNTHWLTKHDIATFRRKLRGELLSISTNLSAEQNIHKFLMLLLSDWFELGIASPLMLAAAWEYGHRKLILMDGTLGACLQKILLFVMLAIDENYCGVPVGLFLFSALLGKGRLPPVMKPKFPNDSYRNGRLHWQRRKDKFSLLFQFVLLLETSTHIAGTAQTPSIAEVVEGGIYFMLYLFKHWLHIIVLSMRSAESRVRASTAASLPRGLLPNTNIHTEGFNSSFQTWGLAEVQARRSPGKAPAPAPEPAPARGLIVFLADPVQDAAARRFVELSLYRFTIQSWDPASSKLVVSVPSATEASKQYAFKSRVPGYCKHLRAARIVIQLATSAGWSLASPASSLLTHSPPASSASSLGPPTSSLSRPLAAAHASENDENSSELAVPIFEPCEPEAVSEVMPLDLDDPEGLAGAIADWLEPDPARRRKGGCGRAGVRTREEELLIALKLLQDNANFLGSMGLSALCRIAKFIAYGAAIEKEGVQQEGETAEKVGVEGKEGKQREKRGVNGEGGEEEARGRGKAKRLVGVGAHIIELWDLNPVEPMIGPLTSSWGWSECERGRRHVVSRSRMHIALERGGQSNRKSSVHGWRRGRKTPTEDSVTILAPRLTQRNSWSTVSFPPVPETDVIRNRDK
ncbi:hypothetical protein BDK51DRAFT_30087 [Blyttiomyces helicus]|uniref:Uncharacterized protein n=1 Tax=Blyttiomyces helicus TaxID=388810 RepID=A0A4P9WJX3_9FUNG|nr:hypothetical protein BDK51DRAFT_30087 [Blyttiomyces helicus]|eukprot:RKO93259.1 hypothetical protein BDK51DRAFT_30087 [Blyttiomyces helicus]